MKKICVLVLLVTVLSGFSLPDRKAKVLIIGDSISIGYFPFVKQELSDIAEVTHNKGNARYSGYGLEHIREWIGTEKWDVIQMNWGLWDLAYRMTPGMKLDKKNGTLTTSLADYQRNLEAILKILKTTHAKLIYVTTSYVPASEPGRLTRDVSKYNKVAIRVMKANGVMINDISKKSKKIHARYGLGDKNVHYSKKGYEELSTYVSTFVRKTLE